MITDFYTSIAHLGFQKQEEDILYQVLDLTMLACSIQTNIGPPWYYISHTISRKLSVSFSWFYYMEPLSLPAVCVHGLCFPFLFFYLTLSVSWAQHADSNCHCSSLHELSSEGVALSHFLYEASLHHFYPHNNHFLSERNS